MLKIRKLHFAHMSPERRLESPYGQRVEHAKVLAKQVAQRSTAVEKAYALVSYNRTLLREGGEAERSVSFSSKAFSINESLDPLDRKEIVRQLLVGSRGILSSKPAERYILKGLFFERFEFSPRGMQLVRMVIEDYLYRLSRSRKTAIYLALTDLTGRKMPLPQMFRHLVEKLGVGKRIGSGSVEQVYRMTTQDGQDAVIKVLRPGAREQIVEDLAILHKVAREVEAAGLAEGIAKQLDPTIDLMPFIARGFAKAYVKKIREAVTKPWSWLKSRFKRDQIVQMRDLVAEAQRLDPTLAE